MNWDDTTPEQRTVLLSPFECKLVEQARKAPTASALILVPVYEGDARDALRQRFDRLLDQLQDVA